jgi:TRAP-type C4-dicarboxylate transport system substrate-binding protein
MRKLGFIALTGAILATTAGVAEAASTIRVSSWAPPKHGMNSIVWPSWGKCIADVTGGSVKVKVEYGLAPPPQQPDVVRDGVADATWMFHGYNPGRYVLTKVVELPGLGTSAEAASVAYWRVHQKYLADKNEHKGLKVLALTSHGAGIMHTKKQINTLADFKGMKVRLGGGVSGAVGKALGLVGVRVPAPKVYETVASGVADGVFMPMETKKSFKLKEVAPFSIIMPGGVYYGSFGLVMNPAKFNSLSSSEQAAVDACSGETLARTAGKMWDTVDAAGLVDAKAFGNTIVTASDAMTKKFYSMVAHIETDWIKDANKKGINAKAALAELRDIARSF